MSCTRAHALRPWFLVAAALLAGAVLPLQAAEVLLAGPVSGEPGKAVRVTVQVDGLEPMTPVRWEAWMGTEPYTVDPSSWLEDSKDGAFWVTLPKQAVPGQAFRLQANVEGSPPSAAFSIRVVQGLKRSRSAPGEAVPGESKSAKTLPEETKEIDILDRMARLPMPVVQEIFSYDRRRLELADLRSRAWRHNKLQRTQKERFHGDLDNRSFVRMLDSRPNLRHLILEDIPTPLDFRALDRFTDLESVKIERVRHFTAEDLARLIERNPKLVALRLPSTLLLDRSNPLGRIAGRIVKLEAKSSTPQEMEHGFVPDEEVWRPVIETLRACTELRELHLECANPLKDSDLLTKVDKLTIYYNGSFTGLGLHSGLTMVKLTGCTALRELPPLPVAGFLEIDSCPGIPADQVRKALEHNAVLNELITDVKLGMEDLRSVAGSLRKLELIGQTLAKDDLKAFTRLENLSLTLVKAPGDLTLPASLEALTVDRSHWMTGANLTRDLKRLFSLTIKYCPSFTDLDCLPTLRHLELFGCQSFGFKRPASGRFVPASLLTLKVLECWNSQAHEILTFLSEAPGLEKLVVNYVDPTGPLPAAFKAHGALKAVYARPDPRNPHPILIWRRGEDVRPMARPTDYENTGQLAPGTVHAMDLEWVSAPRQMTPGGDGRAFMKLRPIGSGHVAWPLPYPCFIAASLTDVDTELPAGVCPVEPHQMDPAGNLEFRFQAPERAGNFRFAVKVKGGPEASVVIQVRGPEPSVSSSSLRSLASGTP